MNNLSNSLEKNDLVKYIKQPSETRFKPSLKQQWLKKAQQYNHRIFTDFSEQTDISKDISVIKDQGGIFEKLIETFSQVDQANKINYCKAIFNYCEMSQDWRVVGIWLKQEIDKLQTSYHNNYQDSAWLYFAYGRYLEETGRLNQSLEFHQKGIKISQDNQDNLNMALNSLGCGVTLQRFTDKKDIEKAIDYLKTALGIFKNTNNYYQQANTFLNLGSCYDRLEKWSQSINSYQQGIKILEKINNQFDLGRTLYSLGIVYLRSQRLQESEAAFIQGKKLCEKSKNNYYNSLICYGLSWVEYYKKNLIQSQQYIEESIRKFNKHKEDYFSYVPVSFYETEGNIFLLAGAIYCKIFPIDIEKVNFYLDTAEKAFKQLDYPDIKLAHVLANRARLYEYTQQWETAIELFNQLFLLGKKMEQRNTMNDAAVHLFHIYKSCNNSLIAWIILVNKLGLSGIWSLFIGLLNRYKRTQVILRYLQTINNLAHKSITR